MQTASTRADLAGTLPGLTPPAALAPATTDNPTDNPSGTPPDVDRIMAHRFSLGEPRSLQYKLGMRAALEHRLYDSYFPDCPYPPEHSAHDAYFAGIEEGLQMSTRHPTQVPA